MALVPCDGCRRHVRSGDSACPFCKAVRGATTVAVTAVAALAIAGCDTFSPGSKYGGPPGYSYSPPDAQTPVTTDVPEAGGSPSATPSTTASSPRLTDPPSDAGHVVAPVSKYGGPPRR
ncbi:MAG: hypothetical protein U0270_26845 [Labilithrix sp.]